MRCVTNYYLQYLRKEMKFFFLSILSLVIQSAQTQQLNFRSFSFEQGLNTYNIQKVIQDKYGFIWIATQDGLYRYNGNTFEPLRKTGIRLASLRENFVFDIFYGGQETLYAATFNGGIDAIDIGTLSVNHIVDQISDSANGLPNLWITKVLLDGHENLWIGGKDYLSIYNLKNKRFTHITQIPGFDGAINVSFIKSLNAKTIAIGIVDLGILLFNAATLEQISQLRKFTPGPDEIVTQLTDLLVIGEDIYLSSNRGIIKGGIINNSWTFKELIVPPGLDGSIINCMTFDGKEDIWIGTNSGMARMNIIKRNFTVIISQNNRNRWLIDNTIRHLMIDSQNNLWVSTSKVLQFVNLNPNPFTHFTGNNPGSSKMDHIYSLVPKSDTEIFATGTDGLYIANLLTERVERVAGSQSLGIVHYITSIDPDMWFVSTDNGMYPYSLKNGLLTQEHLLKLYPEWKPYVRNYFNSSVRINNTIYWASEEQEGLIIWHVDSHTINRYKANTPSSKGLPENHIHNIKMDKEGHLWLLFDNSVARYSVAQDRVIQVIRYKTRTGTFNSGIYFDAYDDGTHIWFGTFGGGINGYNKSNGSWQYITEKDGLCNNAVYGILPERDSIIWVSTNMGISRVNYITRKCTNYYFEDGLQDNSFDEKGALSMDNRLFFGGINGFTMFEISKYQPHLKSFPVYIHRVEFFAQGQKKVLNKLSWEKLELPPNTSSIVVHLSALSFSNSRKINFSYKIKGYQDNYLEVGADNKITLNAMNTGNYELEIRYLNEAGEFIYNNLKLELFIAPFWYQTWWFKILLGLIALGLMYGAFRIRINEVRNEQKIRRSIASDLHDDIGSTLTSAKMLAHIALSESSGKGTILMLQRNLEQASANLRDLVWVLDDRLDTISDLVERLKKFCLPFVEAVNITLSFSIEDTVRNLKLAKSEKRNLYLIVKEAINNSVKYAGCKNITVHFGLFKKKLFLLIEDDGNGFVIDEVTEGNGLKNIKDRAAQMYYSASISSSYGNGTKIHLSKNK